MTEATQPQPQDETDLPILADMEGDEYDVMADMDEDEKAFLLDTLSDEELAALSGGEDEDEAEPAPEPEPVAEAPVEQQNAQQVAPEAALPVALSPEQIEAIDAELAKAQKAALDDWRDGMLTDEELETRMAEARRAARAAEMEAMQAAQDRLAEAAWQRRVEVFQAEAARFIEANPHLKGQREIEVYDKHVRAVTGDADFVGLSDREKLELAAERYLADARRMKLAMPAPKPEARPAKSSLREVVPTLAAVPVAASNSPSEGRWASLQARFDALGDNAAAREALYESLTTAEEREAFASMDV